MTSAQFPETGTHRLPPPRGALEAQTWREIVQLLSNLFLDVFGFVCLTVCFIAGAATSVTVVGLPLLALALLGCRQWGKLERARARALTRVAVAEPTPLRSRGGGFFGWLWMRLRDPVGWRHALYMFVRLPWGWFTFAVTLVSLFVAWPLLPWLARGLTNVDRALVRGLLSPSGELERRIAELESGRGTVADTATADLRRIERDLHDGAQARLVTLAMDLGLAKEKLQQDPEAATHLVDNAHGEVKLALQELRDLARGIHPAILTDRGLGPALSHLATRCPTPLTVTNHLPTTRPARAIEGITYFTASELLQNITKHASSGPAAARSGTVTLWRTEDSLLLQLVDDGPGGARLAPGGGLAGLAERLHAVDGHLTVHSPDGGPTTITAQLPWREDP